MPTSPSETYNQNDLLLWALYLCGGSTSWVDVETMFLKAFELGPASLSWRTRLDLPDYKKCSKALQSLEDPKRSDRVGFIVKRDRYTRMLTSEGTEWCRLYESHLSSLYQGNPQFARTSEHGRRVSQMRESALFQEWVTVGDARLNLMELAELFRCGAHTSRVNWDRRLNVLAEDAALINDEQVTAFIQSSKAVLEQEGIK